MGVNLEWYFLTKKWTTYGQLQGKMGKILGAIQTCHLEEFTTFDGLGNQ